MFQQPAAFIRCSRSTLIVLIAAKQLQTTSSFFSAIMSQRSYIHFLFRVIVSSQNEISFAPKSLMRCSISATTRAGLEKRTVVRASLQNVHGYGQPRMATIENVGRRL